MRHLVQRGHSVYLLCFENYCDKMKPAYLIERSEHDDVKICIIKRNTIMDGTGDVYFTDKRKAGLSHVLEEYFSEIDPEIVHLHHLAAPESRALVTIAKKRNVPVILTYHTPTMTCAHGDLLIYGKRLCRGVVTYRRCLRCIQTKYNIPYFLAFMWAYAPAWFTHTLGIFVSSFPARNKFTTWLQLPLLVKQHMNEWDDIFFMIDQFVSVCQWGSDLLRNNNIPREKISLCRHGASGRDIDQPKRKDHGVLRVGYIGRITHSKGLDTLVRAFRHIPRDINIELSVYGSPGEDERSIKYFNMLVCQSKNERRIKWCGVLREEVKVRALREMDILAIPSRWLETGPLVLLEAWSTGTPIIGSRRGGIAEMVHDHRGGILFPPEDSKSLGQTLEKIYHDDNLLATLASTIPPIRKEEDVAIEMEALYSREICKIRK